MSDIDDYRILKEGNIKVRGRIIERFYGNGEWDFIWIFYLCY